MTTHELLGTLSTTELLETFAGLECPSVADLHGEYTARLLRQPSVFATVTGAISVANPAFPWLAKAFRPIDPETGRGYNTFRQLGRVVQRLPMHTVIAPSRFDGRPAYHLIYRAFHSFCGDINMVDEVRRFDTGTYLGIGTWGLTDAQRLVPLPFVLEGPVHPYRGDIGKARQGFVPGPREIPALAANDNGDNR